MGLITIGGLGSGLDVTSIVNALVEAERAPKQNSLDRLETDVTVTLTGLGGLSSALDELRSAALDLSLSSNFSKRSTTVSDNEFYSATATSSASAGTYDIEVTQLALGTISESQVFTSGGSTTFGDGTLTFTIGSETFDVAVAASDTLSDIRNNINEATGNSDLVSVNLLNNVNNGVDTGSVLTFESTTTGTGNDLVVTFTGDASLADLSTNLTSTQTAIDASIEIDSFTASSSTNKFTDVIDGVTIDIIKQHTAGSTSELSVSLDTASTKGLITGFVTAYNAYIEVSKQLGSADSTAPGLLLGDYTLRQVGSQLRNLFSSPVAQASGDFDSLSAIGISTTQTGELEIDNDVLDLAIANDFEKLDKLFAGDAGFATQLRDLIENYTGSSGVITTREESLNSQLSQIADDRVSLNLRIESLQLRLTKQFSTMDAIVAQLNSTQSYIAQQFENLPGFGKKD